MWIAEIIAISDKFDSGVHRALPPAFASASGTMPVEIFVFLHSKTVLERIKKIGLYTTMIDWFV